MSSQTLSVAILPPGALLCQMNAQKNHGRLGSIYLTNLATAFWKVLALVALKESVLNTKEAH